jgi:hypothetical protein
MLHRLLRSLLGQQITELGASALLLPAIVAGPVLVFL